MASQDFQEKLIDCMPRMRAQALALTRNAAAADDLVQDTALKALKGWDSFDIQTNFPAWIHRIMFNQFISGIRAGRRFTDLDQAPEIEDRASQQDSVDLRDLRDGITRLPPDQRVALTIIAIEGCSYDIAAERTGEPVGTLKSRVHRGRLALRAHMTGDRTALAA